MTAFKFEWADMYLKRPPLVVFDCGSYDATDTLAFKEHWPNATVIGFEACPDNYQRIGPQNCRSTHRGPPSCRLRSQRWRGL